MKKGFSLIYFGEDGGGMWFAAKTVNR